MEEDMKSGFPRNYRIFRSQNHQGLSHNSWLAFAMNYGIPATIVLFSFCFPVLGLVRRPLLIVGACPLIFSFTVEGWLTAPNECEFSHAVFRGRFAGLTDRMQPVKPNARRL